jgi:PadR family transcriptional regulator, regulatory protein AphA
MNFQLTISNNLKYTECLSGDTPFSNESHALEAVAFCHENGTNLLLLFTECLSDDFFKLSTGLAGAIIQKFVNYGIKTALVLGDEAINQGRFAEMVSEANRGNHFRTFPDRLEAESWFASSSL